MTIQDDRYVEATRIYLEACSHVIDIATHMPGEEQPSEQVASKDDSAIHVDKLIIDVKHTEIKMDGNMIPKLVKKSLLLVEKKVFLLMGRRKITSKPCSVCECACLSIKSIRKYEASAISLDGLWTLYISPSIMLRS